ncbi:right-handed parallel beta-helix repeat-containing protein [Winogradskyella sp. SYSU M77433]|uniref:right-handed parallel beta-helix repeat-containing protein n=1 Tax=Winogradskyella sp. SYSU M77433 TaxID=3042722 RepID=UPI002480A1DC|nr:right-handed parallel beta-helix repeat-containing protein [Winogradskyella sp. SYSU M77433]MDH7911286.1 right-handed parallel beta-helix repeat-containing protein [Winogradskyella sp. SYSU M77433]
MKKISLLIALLISAIVSAQTVYTVDNNEGSAAAYTSVQAAINDASAGDIIYIQPSPNGYGDIQMTKTLTIYGLGHNPELNNGLVATVSNILFRYADASGSKISGLNINGIYLDNTTYNNHNVVITNNKIYRILGNSTTVRANNTIISGNYIQHNSNNAIDIYNSQNWIISNNIIEQYNTVSTYSLFNRFNVSSTFNNNVVLTRQNGDSTQSIRMFHNCSGALVSNNIFLFTGNSVTNMNLGTNSGLDFQNNLTYSYNATFDPLSGTNNIDDTDPQFTAFNQNTSLNSTSNDFEIQSGSPAEGAGTDGNDLGVFNGNFPFSLRGYPTELPYLTDFVIYNNIISAGETLDVNVKANANFTD